MSSQAFFQQAIMVKYYNISNSKAALKMDIYTKLPVETKILSQIFAMTTCLPWLKGEISAGVSGSLEKYFESWRRKNRCLLNLLEADSVIICNVLCFHLGFLDHFANPVKKIQQFLVLLFKFCQRTWQAGKYGWRCSPLVCAVAVVDPLAASTLLDILDVPGLPDFLGLLLDSDVWDNLFRLSGFQIDRSWRSVNKFLLRKSAILCLSRAILLWDFLFFVQASFAGWLWAVSPFPASIQKENTLPTSTLILKLFPLFASRLVIPRQAVWSFNTSFFQSLAIVKGSRLSYSLRARHSE